MFVLLGLDDVLKLALLTPYQALCHCGDCKKISGSTFSNNVVVQTDGFKNVSGRLTS